ncbi:CRISPR-associated protein Cas2 [Pseudobacillus sp. FSL P4-0506]|uniref:CRISPR-associated protein Cas2 n=1 Tax=Pseudobacillus sp. FSL P4-0506 TaxID=2921576 RepID=UPI0030F58D64
MSAKIITYDLDSPGQNYQLLIAEIKRYPNCVKITESCWVINNDQSCVDVRDNLKRFIDENDRLLVARLSGEAAWINVICGTEALKKSLNA